MAVLTPQRLSIWQAAADHLLLASLHLGQLPASASSPSASASGESPSPSAASASQFLSSQSSPPSHSSSSSSAQPAPEPEPPSSERREPGNASTESLRTSPVSLFHAVVWSPDSRHVALLDESGAVRSVEVCRGTESERLLAPPLFRISEENTHRNFTHTHTHTHTAASASASTPTTTSSTEAGAAIAAQVAVCSLPPIRLLFASSAFARDHGRRVTWYDVCMCECVCMYV
jgi:hypothetical protein